MTSSAEDYLKKKKKTRKKGNKTKNNHKPFLSIFFPLGYYYTSGRNLKPLLWLIFGCISYP